MLDINMEFRKGVLFVRLCGELTKDTVSYLNKEVTERIRLNGIRNVVFNVEELDYIDLKGVHSLFYNYEICHKQKGKTLLCGLHDNLVSKRIKNSRLLSYMTPLESELNAFGLMKI